MAVMMVFTFAACGAGSEGGDAYHFVKEETSEATIIVHINTEGMGNIEYTEGEETPEIDEEYPYQSAQITVLLDESADYVALFEGE